MALPLLVIGFVCLFMGGSYYTTWKQDKEIKSKLGWSTGLTLFGMYMVVAAMGHLVRHC